MRYHRLCQIYRLSFKHSSALAPFKKLMKQLEICIILDFEKNFYDFHIYLCCLKPIFFASHDVSPF